MSFYVSYLRKDLKGRYSNIKQGKRPDIGDIYFRSAWEANYARYLNFLVNNNEIYRWEYESETFWFNNITRGSRSYTPDFKIWERNGSNPYFVEIKGYMDQKSKTKLTRMGRYYPDIKVILLQSKEYNTLKRQIGKMLNWE